MMVGGAAGLLRRSFDERSDWTARGALGFRFPRGVAFDARYERAPYLNTTASLATTVMTQTIEGTVRWESASEWLGNTTVRRERFDDDNSISTAFVWALAPIVRRSTTHVQLGYSFVAQSAEQSRFIARPDDLVFPPGQPPITVRGFYSPYFTPRNLRIHSALARVRLVPTPTWSLTGNSALGFHAGDDAPVLFTTPGSRAPDVDLRRTFYRRHFTPWRLQAVLDGALTKSIRMAITAEHDKGAFYASTSVGVQLTYTFAAAALRRADKY
jgi:hypothetical protein